jgi:hypothetical protein
MIVVVLASLRRHCSASDWVRSVDFALRRRRWRPIVLDAISIIDKADSIDQPGTIRATVVSFRRAVDSENASVRRLNALMLTRSTAGHRRSRLC